MSTVSNLYKFTLGFSTNLPQRDSLPLDQILAIRSSYSFKGEVSAGNSLNKFMIDNAVEITLPCDLNQYAKNHEQWGVMKWGSRFVALLAGGGGCIKVCEIANNNSPPVAVDWLAVALAVGTVSFELYKSYQASQQQEKWESPIAGYAAKHNLSEKKEEKLFTHAIHHTPFFHSNEIGQLHYRNINYFNKIVGQSTQAENIEYFFKKVALDRFSIGKLNQITPSDAPVFNFEGVAVEKLSKNFLDKLANDFEIERQIFQEAKKSQASELAPHQKALAASVKKKKAWKRQADNATNLIEGSGALLTEAQKHEALNALKNEEQYKLRNVTNFSEQQKIKREFAEKRQHVQEGAILTQVGIGLIAEIASLGIKEGLIESAYKDTIAQQKLEIELLQHKHKVEIEKQFSAPVKKIMHKYIMTRDECLL